MKPKSPSLREPSDWLSQLVLKRSPGLAICDWYRESKSMSWCLDTVTLSVVSNSLSLVSSVSLVALPSSTSRASLAISPAIAFSLCLSSNSIIDSLLLTSILYILFIRDCNSSLSYTL